MGFASTWLREVSPQAWVQLTLVPTRDIGDSRKDIWSKLLPCISKSPTLLLIGRHVRAPEQGGQQR